MASELPPDLVRGLEAMDRVARDPDAAQELVDAGVLVRIHHGDPDAHATSYNVGFADGWEQAGGDPDDEPDLTPLGALRDLLDWWGDSRIEGWEPEQSDGCHPKPCSCGLVAAIHNARLAARRPCCGEAEHPRIAEVTS